MKKQEIKKEIKKFLDIAKQNEHEIASIGVLEHSQCQNNFNSISQETILSHSNMYTREKAIDLVLKNGPFYGSYTNNGTNLLVRNSAGYVGAFNTQHFSTCFEREFYDHVYDGQWLHSEQYFALAQEQALYVYDGRGVELHAVREVRAPRILEFLPYHFLLACACADGQLRYLDTSTGHIVATLQSGERNMPCMRANPSNGVMCVGSTRGTVTMWAPGQKNWLARVNCHAAAVTSIDINRGGTHLITTGSDARLRVFDLRNTYAPVKTVNLRSFGLPSVVTTAMSQRDLFAVGGCDSVLVLREYEDLCVREIIPDVASLDFCPFEDILAVGHGGGLKTIVVPGSGDHNYDCGEDNPFMSTKQRQEFEVNRLLEKIPYDMIGLEKNIWES